MNIRSVMLSVVLGLLTGCESLHFYQQAISGQASLLSKRIPVEQLLEDEATDAKLRRQLELTQSILAFAEAQGLPVEGSYQAYTATDRSHVVWNVFAAPRFELRLQTSCFPVAGCVSYRGYFTEHDAEAHASKMRDQGFDVYVAGVAAYSTLGWFDDPLLDTFLFRSDVGLAALLFHELAHKLIYVKDDTRFNESAATAVERFMLKQWLADHPDVYEWYLASDQRRNQVMALIDSARSDLRSLYQQSLEESQMSKDKERIIDELRDQYQQLRSTWNEGREFESWMSTDINNAKLETIADYHAYVPVMLHYLEQHGLEAFKVELLRLANLSLEERKVRLTNASHKSE